MHALLIRLPRLLARTIGALGLLATLSIWTGAAQAAGAERASRSALIIAIANYGPPQIPALEGVPFDVDSARTIARAMDIPDQRITVLRDAQAPTGMYFVSHDAQGHHFSYARAGSAASRMQPQDLAHWQDAIASSQWLHLSGISLAISASACDTAFAAMQHARNVGTRVALDSNLRLSLWPLARAQACIRHAVSL
jgi:hypothetical protein